MVLTMGTVTVTATAMVSATATATAIAMVTATATVTAMALVLATVTGTTLGTVTAGGAEMVSVSGQSGAIEKDGSNWREYVRIQSQN